MALRGTKLIFPNFIGSKSGLASSVNPDLEVGETIHEKDTNRYKTNLTAETASWNSLPYGAQFISFPLASEFKTYLSGSGDQVIYIEEFEKIYKQTSLVSSSTYTEPDYIIDNNDIVYESVTQGLGFPFSGSAVITGSLLISGSGTVLTASGSSLITEDLTVQGRILDSQSLAFWGAVGDGVTDDTLAIQTALNSNTASTDARYDEVANLTGGTVLYSEPGKTYLIGDTITVPTNVTFDLNQSRIYVTSSHDAVRLKPGSRLENGTILISSSLDYTDKSAILILASASAEEEDDKFFPNIRRVYETTAGVSRINFRGPALTEDVTGPVEAKNTGNAILLKAEANALETVPNIVDTRFNSFDIIGFKYGIHCQVINPDIEGAIPFINSNQFSDFGIKHTTYGIYLETNQTPGTEISASAGLPSSERIGAVVNQNIFTNFWYQPVVATYSTNNAIVNYGEKNVFDNFTIWDYQYAFTGSVADGGSPFKEGSPQYFTPNGYRLNGANLAGDLNLDFTPAAIVDYNPQGGNVYNGGFQIANVQDRSYSGANKYNSTNFADFGMQSPIDHVTTLPPYHEKGLPIGDQNDYLAYAYERGFGVSQSRYPDSTTGSRYDNISQSISTVFEPYGNGFVRYNSVTESVELTISFPQEEFNSYIREFDRMSIQDYYRRSDNLLFKGLGVRFKEQEDKNIDNYYQTPEHVKISVIQRNRSGAFVEENTIYEYNDNKTLFLGDVGKTAYTSTTNGGFWDVKVMFSSSAEQDNPVALERISCWLGTDDTKAYIKRSDDYYYGGLEFKPVYGRNIDGTVDTSNVIREASLTVSGSIISTEKQIISGSSYLVPAIAQGATGDTVYLTGSNYDNVSIVRAIHDNGSNGVLTLVLPHSTGSNELHRTIRIISNGSADAQHNIDIIPPAGDTLDGSSSGFTINRSYEGLMVWSDGTEWFRIQSKG